MIPAEEKDLNRNNKCIWGSVQFNKTQTLCLGSFYRPPLAPTEQLEELESSLTELFSRSTRWHPNIVIARIHHKVFLYCRANFDGLRRDMAEFSQLFLAPGSDNRSEHINGNWLHFKEALTSAIKKHIPTRLSIFVGFLAMLV